MSQYNQGQGQYYGQPGVDPYQQAAPKTSAMAVASLVCSLICCIPVLPAIGALLGLFALVSIGSNPMKRGKGLAVAGLLLGILFTAGQIYFGYTAYRTVMIFKDGPYEALQPGFQGDYATMRANFGAAGQAATDEEARAFIEGLRAAYGELQGSEIDLSQYQGMQQPGPGQTTVTMPWVLVFDSGRVDAELSFTESDQAGQDDKIIFSSITILDSTLEYATFPPPEDEAADGGTNGASDDATDADASDESPGT